MTEEDKRTGLEVIAYQSNLPHVDEAVLDVMSPENRKFYNGATRVNLDLPDIPEAIEGTRISGEIYDKISSLVDRVNEHIDSHHGNGRSSKRDTLKRLAVHYLGRFFGKTLEDLDRKNKDRTRTEHARFVGAVYEELRDEIAPSLQKYLAALSEEYREKQETIQGTEERVMELDRYLTHSREGIGELEAGLEEIEDESAREEIRTLIKGLDDGMIRYAVEIGNLVQYGVPEAQRDSEVIESEIEYFREFMRVAPLILSDFRERVRKGRHDVSRGLRKEVNRLLCGIQTINENGILPSESSEDKEDALHELRAFAEVLDLTNKKRREKDDK